MTTATASPPEAPGSLMLDENAQGLIDARLDSIERMLHGQVSRLDRLAIVREVESQIHELLIDRDPATTDRDAVIAALGRLDPPEAFLPDEMGLVPRRGILPVEATATRAARPPARPAPSATDPKQKLGQVGGILGLVSAGLLPVLIAMHVALVIDLAGELSLYAIMGVSCIIAIVSLLAITFATISRLQTRMAAIGLATGIVSATSLVPVVALVVYAFTVGLF